MKKVTVFRQDIKEVIIKQETLFWKKMVLKYLIKVDNQNH